MCSWPKGKLNHSGLGRHIGEKPFPLNCGLESFIGLAVLPEVCVCMCVCDHEYACMCLYEQEVSMCMHLCTLVCVLRVGHSTKRTL